MITYTKMFEKIGNLPFNVHEKLEGEFEKNINEYCKNVLELKIFKIDIITANTGTIKPMFKTDLKGFDDSLVKYWIPFQDKTLGHWFEYNGVHIHNYKAKDVYRIWGSGKYEQCSGNLGTTKCITLEILGANWENDDLLKFLN